MTRYDILKKSCINFFEYSPHMNKEEFMFFIKKSTDMNGIETTDNNVLLISKLLRRIDILENNIKILTKELSNKVN